MTYGVARDLYVDLVTESVSHTIQTEQDAALSMSGGHGVVSRRGVAKPSICFKLGVQVKSVTVTDGCLFSPFFRENLSSDP